MEAVIEIVGAVNADAPIGTDEIEPLLHTPTTPLGHDGEFTGRPSTRVHVSQTRVLKLREVEDPTADIERLRHDVEEILHRERLYGLAPPSKTWFIVRSERGFRIGNIAPRLLPLHLPDAEDDPSRFFKHLRTMLQMYVGIAARYRVRLDEGLSNFAYDTADRLYYIDDDFYDWDDFAHFNQWIGVAIRKVKTLSPKFAQVLGQAVRQSIVNGFGNAEPCAQIAHSVRNLFFQPGAQEQRRDGFIQGITGVSPHSRSRRASEEKKSIALIADIHANLPALKAVLAGVRERDVTQVIVLGDIVGYGPHPRECIDLIRASGFEVIRGNHDHAAATGVRPAGFGETAFKVIEWTRKELDASELEWLGALPTRIERDGWLAQHGAPMDPTFFNAYVYRLTYEDNLKYLAEHGIRWAFHGHTHTQSVFYATEDSSGLDESKMQSLADYQQALVCPGSVGQPRRGGIDAQWALFNPATMQIEFMSAAYDVEETVHDMIARQLPSAFVERLRAGN